MAACAGVQKVSRPIERCQEMSQMMPTFALVAATSVAATYQGRCAASGGGRGGGGPRPLPGLPVNPAPAHHAPSPPPLPKLLHPLGRGGRRPPRRAAAPPPASAHL